MTGRIGSSSQVFGFFSKKKLIDSLKGLKKVHVADDINKYSDSIKNAKDFSSAKRKSMAFLALSLFVLGFSLATFFMLFVFSRVPVKALLRPHNVMFFLSIPVLIMSFAGLCIFANAVSKQKSCSDTFREDYDFPSGDCVDAYEHKDSRKLRSNSISLSFSMFFMGLSASILFSSLIKSGFNVREMFTGVGDIVVNAPVVVVLAITLISMIASSISIEYYQRRAVEEKKLFNKTFSNGSSMYQVFTEELSSNSEHMKSACGT